MAAFDPATLDRWRALAIVDRDGTTVGTINEFYLDRETGYPTWALVNTGLFGATQTFVPLVHATEISDGLQVPYEKSHIKDTPRVDLHDELTPDEEATLFAHYGVEYQPSPDPTALPDEGVEAGTGKGGEAGSEETAEAEGGEAGEVGAGEGAGPGPAEQGAVEGPGPVPPEPAAVEGPESVPAEPGEVEGPGPVPAEPGMVEDPGAVPEPASAEDPAAAPSEPGSAEGPEPAAAETAPADRHDEPAASGSTQTDPDPYAAPEPESGSRETTGGLTDEPGTAGPDEPVTAGLDEPGTAGRDEPVAAGPDDATLVAPGGFGSASEPRGAQPDPDAPRDTQPDPDVDPSQAPPADPDLSRTAPVEPGLPGSTAASLGPVPTTINKDDLDDLPRRAADEPSWPPGFDGSAPADRPAASDRWREAKLAAERNRIARAAAAPQPEERSPLERARRRLERLVGVGQDHPDPDDIPDEREDDDPRRR
jgi:hypothetical protein